MKRTICERLGCNFTVGPGGHRLPEGAICKQCAEKLRHMARTAAKRGNDTVGVALKPSGQLAIFASWDSESMVIRGEAS